MDILNKPIITNSFNDIVNFCKQGEREGFELDYKQDLPSNGLSKHFAAFSNTRGGLIIIGIEEDKATGIPKAWIGIDAKAQSVERVHQWVSNVTPIPRYEVHVTDIQNGKFFILIRILEGDRTPYYVQNDANIWVRTGNISNPISIASPDSAELLFGRKEKADLARTNYFKRAHEIYDAGLRNAERDRKARIATEHADYQRKEESGMPRIEDFTGEGFKSSYYNMQLGTNVNMCTIAVQPFYPKGSLVPPEEIKNKIREIQNGDGKFNEIYFPDLNVRPIPEGALHFSWGENDGDLVCHQMYSTGLVYLSKDVLRIDRETDQKAIYLASIMNLLFQVLKATSNYYKLAKFQGGVRGFINLKNVEDLLLIRALNSGSLGENIKALLPEYTITIDTDTTVLNDDKKFQEYYSSLVKELYWSVGYPDLNDNQITAYLKSKGWLIE